MTAECLRKCGPDIWDCQVVESEALIRELVGARKLKYAPFCNVSGLTPRRGWRPK